jgi:hypothetical protein
MSISHNIRHEPKPPPFFADSISIAAPRRQGRWRKMAMKLGTPHLFENPVGKTEHEVIKEQMDLM